jgi:hypothetical protein
MKEQSGFKVFRKSKSIKNNFNLFWIMFRIKGMQKQACIALEKRMSIVICITKKKKQNTSRSSAIVTLSIRKFKFRDTKQD